MEDAVLVMLTEKMILQLVVAKMVGMKMPQELLTLLNEKMCYLFRYLG
jgi:hypothetical protein